MDESTSILSLAIGARVKQERQTRGWTLDQLAEAAGVSRRMIINVEQGAANPSVGTLLRTSVSLNLVPALVPNSVRSGPHPGLPQPSGG
ncbi:helix-turn-helix domain-containing protein [Paenarthrobacter nicotinovorans]|uniref:helix-turn-helix domain-containing protein n=1 Tax=Paenarthrobacter nicotinovorans TaxID=29320 RepID=UPI00047B5DD6